ncbi:unnamed protein product [Rotaria sp. Silwood1]|nr:unnamed protein product [Rotaria sp. Silwood1]CAF4630882.1 unnamed protein product [Rotaria sp. Silwood1]
MSYQQPPPSSTNSNLPPFDWSLPGRNFSGGPPPLMAMPNRDDVRLPSTMERVLKFRDNQHEEDRVTKLHSGGHQTDSGIEQNDDYNDESDDDETSQNNLSRKAKKEIEKRRRRRRAKKKNKSITPSSSTATSESSSKENNKTYDKKKKKKHESDNDDDDDYDDDDDDKDNDDKTKVEIDYVPEDLPIKRGDVYYKEFVKVFENFKLDQNNDDNNEYYINKYGKKVLAPKALLPRDKTNLEENDDEDEKETTNYDKKKKDLDDEEQNKKKSKKQMKRETRLSVAQLKQLVIRPDVVEMFDVTAKDPKLLVHLKATRNTVPVPRHWCAKRKYLQGKRGIEKPPFQLPDFIRRTGIMEMREALQEKEQNKTLKQKMREKVRPKLGKIDIDYQKLHDAFFRWQTKPRMSIHGDLYYEGKENETRLKDKKPGVLSEELRVALGIPVGPTADKYPPPWLIAMQRYGPPPSYPNLKIPGLNAPIPEGCQFGYHSGGWGKPPVDEHGRPLYGDVFGTNQFAYIRSMNEEEHIDKNYWGEIEEEEQEQEAVSSSDEEETTEDTGLDGESTTEGQIATPTAAEHAHHHVHHHHHAASEQEQNIHPAGFQTPHGSEGFVTPSGTQSSILGTETPQQFELRKSRFHAEMDGDTTPALYTVLPEKNVGVGQSSLLSTNRVYDFQAIRKDQMGQSTTTRSDTSGGVDIALNPDELDMNTQALEARYRQELKDKELAKEDLSDMITDHLNKQNKKRKSKQTDTNAKGGSGGGGAAKKMKEFKF